MENEAFQNVPSTQTSTTWGKRILLAFLFLIACVLIAVSLVASKVIPNPLAPADAAVEADVSN